MFDTFQVVFRGFRLIRNLTLHDILSVDAILQHSLAPDLMLSLWLNTGGKTPFHHTFIFDRFQWFHSGSKV